jgi:hypothetical protein
MHVDVDNLESMNKTAVYLGNNGNMVVFSIALKIFYINATNIWAEMWSKLMSLTIKMEQIIHIWVGQNNVIVQYTLEHDTKLERYLASFYYDIGRPSKFRRVDHAIYTGPEQTCKFKDVYPTNDEGFFLF